MKKYIAEFIGTFTLVLFGCGSAVISNIYNIGMTTGILSIAFAFGLALIAMAYGIGHVSGCHINPAVSIGVFMAGRMDAKDLIGYIVSQFLGGIVGALVLMLITKQGMGGSLGANGWASSADLIPALIFEFVATFLFVVVILGSTSEHAPNGFAGLIIGLTLVVIHIDGIPITGVSVNPARSLGPAIFSGGTALSQLWLFLIVPTVAGLLAGVCHKSKLFELDK